MRIVTMADTQANLEQLADEVITLGERVLVARDGGEHLVIISARELESIEATMELLADPEAQAGLAEGKAQLAAGEVYTLEEVEAAMARRQTDDGAGAPSDWADDQALTERVNAVIERIGTDSSTDAAISASRRYLRETADEW